LMNTVAPSYLGNGKDYWYRRSTKLLVLLRLGLLELCSTIC